MGYPPLAQEAEIQGKVLVRILVGKDGSVKKKELVEGAHPILDKAVLGEIGQLKFTPAIFIDQPLEVFVNIPFDFRLVVGRKRRKGK